MVTDSQLPEPVGLQLARLVSAAPAGKQWLHEVKYDGYRVLIWRNGDMARVTSRGDQDWSKRLPATRRAVQQLHCRSCVLDGELIALDAQGHSSFARLQQLFGQAGARERLGSLLLATPGRPGTWRYRGRVGTGLDEHTIVELLRRLRKSRGPVPLENPPARSQLRGASPLWVRPELVVEVEFRGETKDGLLRQASLKGVRHDRDVESLRAASRDTARVEAPSGATRS